MKKAILFALSAAILITMVACKMGKAPTIERPSVEPAESKAAEKNEEAEQEKQAQWAKDVAPLTFIPDWTVPTSTEEFLLALCDEKYEGRVTGSKGNRLAADWLEKQFSAMGLQIMPGLDAYRQRYMDEGFETLPGTAVLISPDGSQVPLELGVDWTFRPSAEEINLTLPLSADIADCQAGRAFLDANQTKQDHPRNYIQIDSGDVAGNLSHHNAAGEASWIRVTEALYEQLCQDGAKLRLTLPKSVHQAEVDNVVAYLPGADHKKLVVLGAHYDGAGFCGTLMPSAYDNASGVAVLLQTAQWLSKAEDLPCDVAFVSFNGSENGQDGSKAFAEFLSDDYDQILVINLKCVGWKNEPLTIYAREEQKNFANELAGGLNIQYRLEAFNGDQQQFRGENMLPLVISQEAVLTKIEIGSKTEKTYDTVDNLDPKMLDDLSRKLSAWIIERGADTLTQSIPVVW